MRSVPREAIFWLAGLAAVASIDPNAGGGINLCLLEQVGLPCPGDGLGRAIALLTRGRFAASWAAHPLAGPAVAGLLAHVVRLSCRARRSSQADSSVLSSASPTAHVQGPPTSP